MVPRRQRAVAKFSTPVLRRFFRSLTHLCRRYVVQRADDEQGGRPASTLSNVAVVAATAVIALASEAARPLESIAELLSLHLRRALARVRAIVPPLPSSTTTSAEPATSADDDEIVDLRDPWLAAVLTWLIPGLGQWYQRRRAKAVLFFLCIMGTYAFGLYLGDGRVVYASLRPEDRRLPYLCQVGVGLPSLPALVQAQRFRNPELRIAAAERQLNNQATLSDWFMAPPFVIDPELAANHSLTPGDQDRKLVQQQLIRLYNPGQQMMEDQADELDLINKRLHRFFELGTVYTMIAGLLNLLAIYDAWGGPAQSDPIVTPPQPRKKDEKENDE